MKPKIGEFEDGVREGFYRRPKKELTGVVQGVSGKRMLLVRFQDRCDNDLTSNQLTTVSVERRPMTEEDEVPTISKIPDEAIDLEKRHYHGELFCYILIRSKLYILSKISKTWRNIHMRSICIKQE